VDVKGFYELIGDLIKDDAVGKQTLAAGAGKAGAHFIEQNAFVVFSDKPVSPGDQWESPIDIDLPGVGKLKGKVVYTYEADDKVGDRKTVRIGVAPEVSIEFKVEADVVKIIGTLSTGVVTGTVQFDPAAGRVLNSKRSISVSGRVNVDVDGMTVSRRFSNGRNDDDRTARKAAGLSWLRLIFSPPESDAHSWRRHKPNRRSMY